ncbi:MAG TPA: PEGA domain-containing protein [Polyangiaceae bacterium]|nr:PEGA domain-containing protein [Polyangiaceae bacterium]
MKRARRRASALLLVAVLSGFAAPGAAQEQSELERAKASFKAGANAYAAGDYLAAIQALEAAYELTPLPAIAFSLAQAERKQYGVKQEREHLARALELFRRYLAQEPNGARRGDAQLAIVELTPQLHGAPVSDASSKAPTRPTRVMIVSETPGAQIALDGGPAASSPLIREVSPGKHHARVAARGYYDLERDVTAVSGELILSEARLTERPTPLYVWAPEGADIYVDGLYAAEGGPLATIPLAVGAHQLMVAQQGRRAVRRDIQLKRGEPHTEAVNLEPTSQRTFSGWLFVGSAGALTGGIILSAFAVRSENRAENFLARQRRQNVSPAELTAYNGSLAERNRFRTAAVINVAASFGLLITGLFLRELDPPSLPAAPRRSDSARNEPRLSFSPVSTTGDPGASLQLNF